MVGLIIARLSNKEYQPIWSTTCLSWISGPNPPPLYPDILLFLHQLVSLGMLFKGQYVLLTVSVSLLTDHSIQHSTYLLNVCILSHQWEHCPTCCLQRGLSSHEASAGDSQRSDPNETLEQSRATYWRYSIIPTVFEAHKVWTFFSADHQIQLCYIWMPLMYKARYVRKPK